MLLSIHDKRQLRDHYDANVARPRWRPWFRSVDAIPNRLSLSVSGGEIGLGGLSRAFRAVTEESRVRFAAYQWLYPHEREMGSPEGLAHILAAAGLDHLDSNYVLKRIGAECRHHIQLYPETARWVRTRVALLECERPDPPPRDLSRATLLLRSQLLRTVNLLWQDPEEAATLAEDLIDSALRGAAQAVHADLGAASRGALNATLMLPSPSPKALARFLSRASSSALQAELRASDLWEGLPSKPATYLTIVAETVEEEHLGFWVPVVEGEGGSRIPGAPQAFANHTGSCVLRHDVPPLTGFSSALTDRWTQHIKLRVRGRHFVSLPFVVERDEGMGASVLAVVNVNADPAEGEEWYRALHTQWLERARVSATPFVEIAFYALLAKFAVLDDGEDGAATLDTPAEWKTLPGLSLRATRKALEKNIDEK